MGYKFSKAFGPTDSAAATETQVGSDYNIPVGGPYHIHEIIVGKGNVVNAKQACGFIEIKVKGVSGTFQYAYGNGAGGATNSSNMAAEKIQCRIPAPSSAIAQVLVTDAENAKDVTVSLAFWTGRELLDSYCWTDANQDTTADTELTLLEGAVANLKITQRPGFIRQIRLAGSGVTDAKAGSGILELVIAGNGFPQEFAIGNGPGGATLSGPAFADVIGDLDKQDLMLGRDDGPIAKNAIVIGKLTTAEIYLSAYCSIQIG